MPCLRYCSITVKRHCDQDNVYKRKDVGAREGAGSGEPVLWAAPRLSHCCSIMETLPEDL